MTYWNKDPDSRLSEIIQQQLIRAAPFGIFGYKNMTLKNALRYRTILTALLKPLAKDQVQVAIFHYLNSLEKDEYEVHLFSLIDSPSAFCKLAALALAIEQIDNNTLFIMSEYDYGTSEPKMVKSWKLF